MLVKKYHDTHSEDKEVLITIKKAIDASPELRSKKQLIETFIARINDADDVMTEWHDYIVHQREKDLQVIITDEKLKPADTRKFMENVFRDGEIKTVERIWIRLCHLFPDSAVVAELRKTRCY